MDGTMTGVASIPLFSELKNDEDNQMSFNETSLSEQIEFILQDSLAEKPVHSKDELNDDSSGDGKESVKMDDTDRDADYCPSSSSSSLEETPSSSSVEFNCEECPEKFDNREIYDIHMSGHANNMKCAICNMVLKSLRNYEKHCLRCKPYECQICGRIVRFRPNFIKHMRVHTGQQSERHKYKCEVCQKEFMSFEYFKVHKKIHNENVNLTCDVCGKVFSALASLRGHSKLHSGFKLHKCDVCGKGFGQRYNLKIHSRTHTGNFPFECKVCKKKLHTQSSLQTHMQTHQKIQVIQTRTTVVCTSVRKVTKNETTVVCTQLKREHKNETVAKANKPVELKIIKKVEKPKVEVKVKEKPHTTIKVPVPEDSSNESNDNVIKNDVQNGPQEIFAQCSSTTNSPSLAVVKREPNLYSGDNSVEMLIKKEPLFEECNQNNSPPTSKFHSNFESDLVDNNDLTNSLSYSNLFEPSSIPDSIPDDIYPEDDDFRLDQNSLGLQTATTTDGDFIKKEWVYSNYSVGEKFDDDDFCEAASFIYD